MKKYFMITFFFIFFVLSIFSEESQIVGYEEFIKMISDDLPKLKTEEINIKLAKEKMKEALSIYDVNLNYSIGGVGKKNYNDLSSTKINYMTGFDTYLNLSTTLPSGTSLLFGGNYGQFYSWGSTGASGSPELYNSASYDPVISFKISQPLIYNWFGFIDRYAYRDAKAKHQIAILKKEVNYKEILFQYEKKYFYWIITKIISEKINEVIENAKELEKQSLERKNSNLIDDDTYQKSVYNRIKYEILKNNIDNQFYQITTEIKLLLEKSLAPEQSVLVEWYENKQFQEQKRDDFLKTSTGQIMKLTKEILLYQKKIAENKSLPKLNLTGDVNVKFHNYQNDASTISNVTSYGDVDFVVGLEFYYPIGDHKNISLYNQTLLLMEQFEVEEKLMLDSYEQSMILLLLNKEKIRKTIELKETALISLQKRLKSEKIKYNNAEIDISYLLETKNLIVSEEIEILNLKLDCILLYLEYKKLNY